MQFFCNDCGQRFNVAPINKADKNCPCCKSSCTYPDSKEGWKSLFRNITEEELLYEDDFSYEDYYF